MLDNKNCQPDTILIVDDNPVSTKLIKIIVDAAGYKTCCANDGRDCLDKVNEYAPNLILLDIDMPVMNGIDACKHLKQRQVTEGIPVIFVTANLDDNILKEAFNSGGTDYVRKPVNQIELLARIKTTLDSRKFHQERMEKEKLAGVIEMSGAICHEINQPLQSIYAYCETVTLDGQMEKQVYDYFSKIYEQIKRIATITKKVSRIKKYESRDYLPGRKIIDIEKASEFIGRDEVG
ncbi:MAG: response regulator [Deltaproteobacteria bacterium]|nr:response regulator [Deltaproteobacteria bacterium]